MSDTKPFSVSYSKMGTFRRCLQQYHWKYKGKFYPPSSMGQARGTAGHAALAVWHQTYVADDSMQKAWDTWSNAGYEDNEDWKILEDALNRYFAWSASHDEFVLKVAEQKFDLDLMIGDVPVVLTGYIDGIVEEKGFLWLLENKFYKQMQNNDNPMDMQVSTYMLAAHKLNYDAKGVIYNKVRVTSSKIALTEPVVRSRQYRNAAGLERVEQDILCQIQAMLKYEEGGVPYRNPTNDCSWDCAFHAACLSMTDDGQEPGEILEKICNLRRTEDEQEKTAD
jgi:hypothetical protein